MMPKLENFKILNCNYRVTTVCTVMKLIPKISLGSIHHRGRNKLNLKRVGMIFNLVENFTNYSLDLPPSFSDNVKSAGPP